MYILSFISNISLHRLLSSMDRTVMENQQLNALFDSMMSSRQQRATGSQQLDSLDDMANQMQLDRLQSTPQHQDNWHSNLNYNKQLSEKEWQGILGGLLRYKTVCFFFTCLRTYFLRNVVDVISSSLARGPCDCAICMLPVNMVAVAAEVNAGLFSLPSSSSSAAPLEVNNRTHRANLADQINHHSNNNSTVSNTSKRIVALSCSHLFHEFCIHNFEKFLGLAVSACFML